MEWVRGKTIGHGSFAAVSSAKPINHNSNLPSVMAVKSCGVSHSESLKKERIILEELKDCPEIINCFGDSVTVENGVKLYNVALEYASGGALSERVKNSDGNRLSENDIRRYTKSVLNGLQFIHGNGFVHCDIKLENVLLFSNGAVKDEVKIADFGLAKKSTEVNAKYDIRGTPMYLAPETVMGGVQEPASDIWALGCLVAEMVTGTPIWNNCADIGALFMRIGVGAETPDIPGKLSEEGKDFIGKCFLKDPRMRWTAEMLLRHPFVERILSEDVKDQISPRDPFDFPDWETNESKELFCCEVTPEVRSESPKISPAVRLGGLLTVVKPDWSVSESWVAVR